MPGRTRHSRGSCPSGPVSGSGNRLPHGHWVWEIQTSALFLGIRSVHTKTTVLNISFKASCSENCNSELKNSEVS